MLFDVVRRVTELLSMLTLTNIHKSYGDDAVLNGIDLTLSKGKVLVLLGPSGSGKSTLLKCINLLETPSSGSMHLNDKLYDFNQTRTKLSAKTLQSLRNEVGMVFQQFNLWSHLNVLHNLTLAARKVLKLSKNEAEKKAVSLLKQLGLESKKESYPAMLSGGQKQRVSIARSLMMSPQIMLFDEPTSALDPEMVNEVLAMIKSLKENGMTMIISTHEIEFAKAIADEVIFIEGGKVYEQGGSEIIDQPKTARMSKFLNLMNHEQV